MKSRMWAAGLALVGALLLSGAVWAEEPFDQLQGQEFYFASGVGAWSTHLWIAEDGSFWGRFADSDMGSTGEGYPHGTVYEADFTGVFSGAERVDEYTYRFWMDYVSTLRTPEGPGRIVNEILYVPSAPYGVQGGKEFELYLPGTPVERLPEGFVSWVRYLVQDGYLEGYGLYNVEEENGFSSSYMPLEEGSIWERLITSAWEKDRELSEELMDLPQQQMNLVSGELYEVWDKCLNDIWAYLREQLEVEQMDVLTEEELAWIEDKEDKIVEAGALFLHGSLQPFMENTTAASFTQQRIYELWYDYRYLEG